MAKTMLFKQPDFSNIKNRSNKTFEYHKISGSITDNRKIKHWSVLFEYNWGCKLPILSFSLFFNLVGIFHTTGMGLRMV